MKRHLSPLLLILPLLCFLASCSSTGSGPTSWIDKPLNKSSYPLEPLELIAHASSDSGVSSIKFTVNGQILDNVSVGSGRFEAASVVWHPDEPGIYTIGITANDSNGNKGSQAVSLVYIGGAGIDGIVQAGPGFGDCSNLEVFNFIIDPPVIPKGECTSIFWEVISLDEFAVILDNAEVPPIGEMQICPGETRPFDIFVESPAGICQQWQSVFVNERLEEPEFLVFEAHPPLIHKGECSILFWEVHPPGEYSPQIDGVEVPFQGEAEVCPEITTSYLLTSEFSPDALVTIEVISEGEEPVSTTVVPEDGITPTPTTASGSGATNTPTTKPSNNPTDTPTTKPSNDPTDTPTPDTTPPVISNASVSPNDFIYNTNGSCSPTTFKFSVKVTDSGGISSVKLNWSGSGVRSGPENMNYSGGKYVKNLGLFVNTGSLSNFSITATDNAGNTSTKNLGWNLDVEECGG